MAVRSKKRGEELAASLKDLMTAAPTSVDEHAAMQRRKVQARRMLEDARDAARLNREFAGFER